MYKRKININISKFYLPKNFFIQVKNILLFLSILYSFSNFNFTAKSLENLNNTDDSPLNVDYLKREIENDYILGPGDVIKVKFSREIPNLNGVYKIDSTGTVNLPKLNRVYISGLTLRELATLLNKELSKFLKFPDTVIDILEYRPIRVFIDGEVNQPGLYTMAGSQDYLQQTSIFPYLDQTALSPEDSQSSNVSSSFPTIYDAIKQAGGITLNSNLKKVTVIRKLSRNRGLVKTELNFLDVLVNGNFTNNLRILDGDIIKLEKSETIIFDDILNAIKLNINPNFIDVLITGRVDRPGQTRLGKISYLNDGIAVAGIKNLSGKIIFRRINNDGSVESRNFRYSKNSKDGSYKNPRLKTGDLIIVDKSLLNVSNSIISELTAPFIGIYSTIKLFD